MELYKLKVNELHRLLADKEITAVEICKAFFKRIEETEDKVKAFITLTKDLALEQAAEVDRKIASGGEIGPLAGIPAGIKDNICTDGVLTSCGSKMLSNYVPPFDATVVERLKGAGVVFAGKTNMDEFAMGSSTENSYFPPTKNPWNLKRVPGGSSGGSAASVAAGEVPFALGTDSGGSIRQPASYCGVVGIKPTYGAVSRYGVVACASSVDQVGCLTRDAVDCAYVLDAICGYDPMDSTSAKVDYPGFTKYLDDNVKGKRIGLPREYLGDKIDPGVKSVILKAADVLEDLGAIVEEVSLPHAEYSLPAYSVIAAAEISSNMARFDGVRYGLRVEGGDVSDMFMKTRREGFGAEVKRRILLGTYSLSSGYYDAYYLRAQKVRTLVKKDFDDIFEEYDVLLSPTTPTTAFEFGERFTDPVDMYLSDMCTASVNLAGLPALSLTGGFVDGLPVGMQLIGKAFGEGDLIRTACAFEQNTGFHKEFAEI